MQIDKMSNKRIVLSSKFLRAWIHESALEDDFNYLRGLCTENSIDDLWCRQLLQAPTMMHICLASSGLHTRVLSNISERMNITEEQIKSSLRLDKNKISNIESPSPISDNERIIKLCCLIGRARLIVEESGIVEEFNAAAWVGSWLYSSCPALAGEQPAHLLSTLEGIGYLTLNVEIMQSGAYF